MIGRNFKAAKSIQLLILGLVASAAASPHGPLHEQIAKVTKEIGKDPLDASLYLKRGNLHRFHEDWQAAVSDYDSVEILDPGLDQVDLARGMTMLDAGWYDQAVPPLNRFLKKHSEHPTALVTRARVLAKLGENLKAAQDYTAAIKYATRRTPEYYLERAQVLAAAGSSHVDEALHGLEEGMQNLGPIVTLQLYAINLEAESQRYDDALARLDEIVAKSPRKEKWLMRRGKILTKAGRFDEARSAFTDALKEIESLSERRRNTKFILRLKNQLLAAIQQLPAH
ncbi:tetratricopeptide repeat protein [candidate division KSB1 bacterium]|nr:tetratricopeptide repeat protein [candidate division KSB1 bacterium]NIR70526.1 tetratricopeptide repeat protein [candidate division KSB1 bacterium]NIS26199.1 tetratricopeptide repeat protein [candidate division KSB1 bacterium]NIT72977.1 tetratricopeptide repeat protein [candidate division KSB1 bacterium]NIU26846.1 tetratricopeptide repeat protein [candidate division KSB1 bacterium]